MDRSTIIGITIGILAIGLGMYLKGISFLALINPAAILIIFLGTAASVLIAFPMSTIKKVPKLLKVIFSRHEQQDIKELIQLFSEWADQSRKEGVLSLESKLTEIKDPFLTSGLQLAIDGQTPEFIRDVLLEKIYAMEKRHEEGIAVFTQAGTYAPTLGVLGAVLGLIAALANIQDTTVLGEAISAAFIATLFGIFSGYVLWHPFANKLKEKSKREVLIKTIMIEGIVSITSGESVVVLRDKLSSYLSSEELATLKEDLNEEKAT